MVRSQWIGGTIGGRGGMILLATFGIVWLSLAGLANADDFCCPCKNKPQSIEAGDMASASAQCSLTCKRFVFAKAGRCEGDAPTAAAPAPAAAPPAPAAAPPAPAGAGVVSLFKTDNCSGEGAPVAASTPNLPEGYLSFQGESGASIQTWRKPGFVGESTQPVAPGICVSPGWPIASVKISK